MAEADYQAGGGELEAAAALSWLQSLPPSLLEAQEGGLLPLSVDLLDLAASGAHNALLNALLADPESARQAVIAVLSAHGLLAPGTRVWLRPRQLPAALELGVPDALHCLRCHAGQLLSCRGVCVAATALFQQPASRSFQCAVCARVCTLRGPEPPPPCCGGAVHEVEAERVMVQGQVIYLAADSPLPSSPSTHLGSSLLAVHLSDDMAGLVKVGDRVLATGSGRYYGGGSAMAPQAYLPVTQGVQLSACNLRVLQPWAEVMHPDDLGAAARPYLAALAAGRGGLDALLGVLDAALPVAASPLLKLAVLLSAAASGTGGKAVEEGEGEGQEAGFALGRRGVTCRNQVNLMLVSAGPEPHIKRFLRAAAALCPHSVVASAADSKGLVPALDQKFVEPRLGVAVPLAVGGQLAEAGGGVLLLSSSWLDSKRSLALGQHMAAGQVALHPQLPELSVPLGATLWTAVHEQDLSKSGRCSAGPAFGGAAGGGSGGQGGLSLTERIINRFSLPFFSQHDILLGASPETEEEVEALMESILCGGGAGGPAAGDPAALRALSYHLSLARALPQPWLSPEAGALLSAYFQHVRTCEGAQQGALAGMVRVAAACARLRRSASVAAVPDASLAVALVEEKLLAAGGSPSLWPRWREELQRCTPLAECLRGLAEEADAVLGWASGLGAGAAPGGSAGGCYGGFGEGPEHRPEE